ncbi:MAG: hypothetical protein ACXWCQ_33950 [Burkholderiales bacterium]
MKTQQIESVAIPAGPPPMTAQSIHWEAAWPVVLMEAEEICV